MDELSPIRVGRKDPSKKRSLPPVEEEDSMIITEQKKIRLFHKALQMRID